MNYLKRWILTVGLVAMLALPLSPTIWVPFPCFKAPCTIGRGVQSEPDPDKTPELPTMAMDAERIQAIIQAVLHGEFERTG